MDCFMKQIKFSDIPALNPHPQKIKNTETWKIQIKINQLKGTSFINKKYASTNGKEKKIFDLQIIFCCPTLSWSLIVFVLTYGVDLRTLSEDHIRMLEVFDRKAVVRNDF